MFLAPLLSLDNCKPLQSDEVCTMQSRKMFSLTWLTWLGILNIGFAKIHLILYNISIYLQHSQNQSSNTIINQPKLQY